MDLSIDAQRPFSFAMNGRTYTIGALTIGDRFDIANSIRGDRVSQFLATVETVRLPYEVVSATLAAIMCKDVTMEVMVGTPEGEFYSIYYALRRGDSNITKEQVRLLMPMARRIIQDVLIHAHLLEKRLEQQPDPTISLAGALATPVPEMIGINA